MNIPITAALIFPFSATRAQRARLIAIVRTIATDDSPSPASSGTKPTRNPPAIIAAKITASTEFRPSSDQ
jgi:hypothetical protein